MPSTRGWSTAIRSRRDKDSAAANNGALAAGYRYACTGDPRHLAEAEALLEKSRRLDPTSPIVLANLASLQERRAMIAVLRPYVDTRLLRLTESDLTVVLDALLEGPIREDVRRALAGSAMLRKALESRRQQRILAPKAPDAYLDANWAVRLRDVAGAETLLEKMHAAEVDLTDVRRSLEQYEAGERDDDISVASAAAVARYAQRRARAEAKRHRPSVAAAWLLEANALLDLVGVTGDLEVAQKARVAAEKAEEEWPTLNATTQRITALIFEAALEVRAENPPLADAIDKARRDGTNGLLLLALENSSFGTPLAAHPHLTKAITLLRPRDDTDLSTRAALIAKLLDDEPLKTRAKAQRKTPLSQATRTLARQFQTPDFTNRLDKALE